MKMIWALLAIILFGQSGILHACSWPDQPPGDEPQGTLPNIVIIFIDDLGYADIGPFGATAYKTPNLDRMAREGRIFTDFQVSSAVCSASRAALLTGCYHRRVGISGALGPNSNIGLNESETTIAEMCRKLGYATACFGKWHLGSREPYLPLQHGFDEYYGIPYSNDMWPLHPDYAELSADSAKRKQGYPDLPMYEGNEICNPRVDGEAQSRMTGEFTRRAVDFIRRNRERPFFLYVPHPMVHVPLFASEKFRGSSGAGIFGDVMQEVDASAGSILDTIDELQLAERTLVIFTSDNGPWLSYGNHAGLAKPLREGKGTSWEGGFRVPAIMRWTGKIPAGSRCDELASTIDILPTIARLAGAELPPHRIDGIDISSLMLDEEIPQGPRESFYYYYQDGELQAVRDRQYKLVFSHQYRSLNGREGGRDGRPAPYTQLKTDMALYDLKTDPGETSNLLSTHPEVVARLERLAGIAREELGDSLQGKKGNGIRPAGRMRRE